MKETTSPILEHPVEEPAVFRPENLLQRAATMMEKSRERYPPAAYSTSMASLWLRPESLSMRCHAQFGLVFTPNCYGSLATDFRSDSFPARSVPRSPSWLPNS